MSLATEHLRTASIDRVSGITPQDFAEIYLAHSGRPVIVTDALRTWTAPSLWSFDLFKQRYGSDRVAPRLFVPTNLIKPLTLAEYFDYLDAPERLPGGLWIDAATLHPRAVPNPPPPAPLYLAWNVFGRHPELLEEVELSPRFVEDWTPLLPAALRSTLDNATRYFLAGLMIGPKDAQVGLHQDFLETHAYLAQIVGRKRCLLFSPEDSAAVYDGAVDPDEPNFDRFPDLRDATAYECVLNPGELLFIPRRWWHHVVSLDKSITVNYNFFNRSNFEGFVASLFRALPAIVDGIAQSPETRAALGIKWKSRGFDLSVNNPD